MPDGGVLLITARHGIVAAGAPSHLTAGDYVCISVSDTGVGMDELTRKRAMEPFFTTKDIGTGTGLGLSMVDGLAVQSGGGMTIHSIPNLGTTVALWLPACEEAADPASAVSDPAATAASPGYRLLLVDDDEEVRAATAELLDDLGHSVVTLASAAEALDQLATDDAFDCIITDHAMPGMTGFDLATRIRNTWPSLPVVVITGYSDVFERGAAKFLHLTKPFRQEALREILTRAVEQGRSDNVVFLEKGQRA
jgi:CheY-like chemotaxis protein